MSRQLQKERDAVRLQLLQQELAMEQPRLERAMEAKAADDVVERHKANVDALRREIYRTR